jgi:hypothetical protein
VSLTKRSERKKRHSTTKPLSPRHQRIFDQFDRLPDDSIAPDPVSAAVLNMSPWTLDRTNPVKPRQISERIRGRRVGDLRALVRGQPIDTS